MDLKLEYHVIKNTVTQASVTQLLINWAAFPTEHGNMGTDGSCDNDAGFMS